ncbi:MAG: phytanoyl-CoA dioxygenase family protein [Pseudomonadota bacterium]
MLSIKTRLPDQPFIDAGETLRDEITRHAPEYQSVMSALHEDGYAVIDPAFDPDDLDTVEHFCKFEPTSEGRVQDAWKKQAAVGRLAVHAPVIEMLSTVYGRRAFPFQTLNFTYGTEQPAHSDAYHFHSKPGGFMCGVWVALEDISPEAGPLMVYPGSHRLGFVNRWDLPGEQTYADYERHIADVIDAHELDAKPALLKRGQALVWVANLLHGGAPRQEKSRTRLSQVSHYFFEDCAYVTPKAYDLERRKHLIRQPYDLTKRRHVLSQTKHLPQQMPLHYILGLRLLLMLDNPPHFTRE